MNEAKDIATKGIIAIMTYVATLIATVIVSTIILSMSWNNVMPYLFNLPTIDFGQAFALSWVSSILVKQYISVGNDNK